MKNQKLNNRVCTFFSSTGNIGTTNTVYSVAMSLAKQTNARIGVLALNGWDDSSDFLVDPPAYLDSLKSRIAGKMFADDSELLERFSEILPNSLYVLAGNKNRRLERAFTVEDIQYLIERSQDIFDVVLIDAGSNLDNAMSAQSIYESGHLYAVISQQPKVLKRFRQMHEDILNPLSIYKENIHFLINKYQEKSYLLTDKKIAKELDINDLNVIPFTEDGIISEYENKFLYSYTNQKYQSSIDQIAKGVALDMALAIKELAPVKKGFFSR